MPLNKETKDCVYKLSAIAFLLHTSIIVKNKNIILYLKKNKKKPFLNYIKLVLYIYILKWFLTNSLQRIFVILHFLLYMYCVKLWIFIHSPFHAYFYYLLHTDFNYHHSLLHIFIILKRKGREISSSRSGRWLLGIKFQWHVHYFKVDI